MKSLAVFLLVGLALAALLVGVAQLDGYIAGGISLVAATLVSNWYEWRRRAGG
jgi:hypothetical protein